MTVDIDIRQLCGFAKNSRKPDDVVVTPRTYVRHRSYKTACSSPDHVRDSTCSTAACEHVVVVVVGDCGACFEPFLFLRVPSFVPHFLAAMRVVLDAICARRERLPCACARFCDDRVGSTIALALSLDMT